MNESLLSQANIRLYGRVVDDLTLGKTASSSGDGAATHIQQQLSAKNAQLARIYGFEYEGHYYDLPSPALFLVHGNGTDPAKAGAVAETEFPELEIKSAGIKVWSYDKNDYSIRLDMQTGMLEDILLGVTEAEYQQIELSGSRVSGSRVSGSRVSGSRVSASRVSGSRLKGND